MKQRLASLMPAAGVLAGLAFGTVQSGVRLRPRRDPVGTLKRGIHRRVMVSGVAAALLAGLVIAPAVHPAPAYANDIANFTTVFATDVVHAGFGGMRNDGTGTLTVSGVSGTVTKALLYWQGPTNSADPSANAAVTFAGNAVTGTNIGLSNDNCWGFANSQAYRADVTSFVTGNGSFALAGFVKDSNNINVNGASLIVFYADGNAANNRDVVLFDGNDSNIPNIFDADGWNVSLPGINYTSGTAAFTMHVSDGQPFLDDALVLNGSELVPAGAIFQGDSVPNGSSVSGGLWDIKSFDVTSFLSPGPNTLTLTTGVLSDCLSLVVAAIDLPAGAAPPSPAHLTLTKSVDNTGGGTALATDWTLSATGPTTISGKTGDAAITNAEVSPGTYTLAESGGPPGYAASAWSCTGGTLTGSSLVLAAGETASCSITNTFQSVGGGTLGDGHLWLGLRNSDDQGTQFDVKIELIRGSTVVATGLKRCVINLTRNPAFAKDITVAWDTTTVSFAPGDVVKISTRIGTNVNGTKCAGPGGSHNNAVALRFYYDLSTRNSRFDATPSTLYFHSDGGGCDKPVATTDSKNVTTRFLNSTAPPAPSALVKCKDSGKLNFNNGNPYTEVGTWTLP